ncbi:MAG: dipeptide epimerase [Chlorobi bacterium]|nr:dipeptide epimerase [Chlorobiota bacterium]
MIIDRIEIYKLNVPCKEPFITSRGISNDAANLVIRIFTDTGLAGTGECSPLEYLVGETQASEYTLAADLAYLLKGKDPLAVEARLLELDRAVKGNTTLKSAFDMALFDLLAQEAGMPLYKLLGGENNRDIRTDMTVTLDTPERMAGMAHEYKKAGFPAIKVKLGTNTRDDVARVEAIRDALGTDMPVRIDANQGWDAVTAIRTLKALEPYNIEYCEEPIPHWNNRDLVRVRNHSPISIMADESVFDHRDAFRLAAMEACDYFNIKLSKSGGIFNALKIIDIAEAAGMKTQVGCMLETRLGLTALTHLAMARTNIEHFDIDSSFLLAEDPVVGGITYEGKGKWLLPETPGLGASFDPNFLKKMEKAIV